MADRIHEHFFNDGRWQRSHRADGEWIRRGAALHSCQSRALMAEVDEDEDRWCSRMLLHDDRAVGTGKSHALVVDDPDGKTSDHRLK